MKLLTSLLLFALLSLMLTSGNVLAGDPALTCIDDIQNNQNLQILQGKILLSGHTGELTLAMLLNSNIPTKEEQEALSLWVSERDKCMRLGEVWREKNLYPAQITIFNGFETDLLTLTADLYAGKITYGDFAKARASKYTEAERNWASVKQQISQQQQQLNQQQQEEINQRQAMAQQEELARRQAALGILLNQRNQQPYQLQPYQMPGLQTTTSTCNKVGNQVICTTR